MKYSAGKNTKGSKPDKPQALIVDDDKAILEILRITCEMLKFQVFTAEDGEKALTIFKSKLPDIIISDINMPKMNGIDLVNHIKSINPQIPVILITGYSYLKHQAENSETKPDAFIQKPFEIDALCKTIKRLKSPAE